MQWMRYKLAAPVARANLRRLLWQEWTRPRIEHPMPVCTGGDRCAWRHCTLAPLSSRDMFILHRVQAFMNVSFGPSRGRLSRSAGVGWLRKPYISLYISSDYSDESDGDMGMYSH